MYFNFEKILNSKVEKKTNTVKAIASITGEELINQNTKEIPTLLEPLFPKVGLIALAGSSDTGKSSFLRQFAIHISSQKDNFLDFKINATHGSAIILSTEDDESAMSFLLNKQNEKLQLLPEAFANLRFIFDSSNLVNTIDIQLSNKPADVVIIDAFADIYDGEMNATNKVRSYLNKFSNLAKKHECLIIILHHTRKTTDRLEPSKHNLLGSQGFEAKMRLVMELRKDLYKPDIRHLCIVKGNYLPSEYKNESFALNFDEFMIFQNTSERIPFDELVSNENTRPHYDDEIKIKAIELNAKGKGVTEIANELNVHKSTISRWLQAVA